MGSTRQLALTAAAAVLVLGGSAVATRYVLDRRRPAPAPPTAAADPARVAHAVRDRGRLLYTVNCAACHGPDGHGDGPSAATLDPPPRDFASTRWRFGSSADRIRRATLEGIPGTGMPSFAHALAPADVGLVVAHVRSLAPREDHAARSFERAARLLSAAGGSPAAAPWAPPAFDLRAADGGSLKPAALRGRLTLLAFWGTACDHCLKEFPALAGLAARYGGRGLSVALVCADETDPAAAEATARPHAGKLPVYADPSGTVAARFDVQVLPTVVLVDADARVLGRVSGAFDWTSPAVREMLEGCLPAGPTP